MKKILPLLAFSCFAALGAHAAEVAPTSAVPAKTTEAQVGEADKAAADAKRKAQMLERRKAMQAERDAKMKADLEVLKANAPVNLAKMFAGKLTDAEGKAVDAATLGKAKFVAVYFSAHWCPPCRRFTPELVKFVAANAKDNNLAVVFISSDGEDDAMRKYMKEAGMTWGAVRGKAVAAEIAAIEAGVNGIPHLRVYDASGKIFSDSLTKTGQYRGPQVVLEELKRALEAPAAPAPAK